MPNSSVDYPPAGVEFDQPGEPMPPCDVAAEQSVLGGMMLSRDVLGEVANRLDAVHFFRSAHQAIFTAVCDMADRGEPVDVITVSAELEARRELRKIGGAPYLHTLIATVPTAANVGYYVGIVADRAARRWLGEAGGRLLRLGADTAIDVESLIEHALASVMDAQLAIKDNADDMSLGGFEDEFFDDTAYTQEHGPKKGVLTGFADLDELTNGLKPGQFVIAGGRPGMGKSTFAADVARSAAIRHEIPTLFISLEMSRLELNQRIRCAEAKVRLDALQRKGGLSDADLDRLRDSAATLRDKPLFIDDRPGMTVAKIAAQARQFKARHDIGLVVIDYLQLITPTGQAQNREQEVARISRQLKLLAKELEVPILIAAQVNRAATSRADKRPQLSDLRESGALESDADLVILVDRPENHDGRDPGDDSRVGEVDLVVAKNRSGRTGLVVAAAQLHFCRFVDMASDPDTQQQAGAAAGGGGQPWPRSNGRAGLTVVPAGPRCRGCRQVMTDEDSTADEIGAGIHADCARQLG
jgi:replicative DNA helicase